MTSSLERAVLELARHSGFHVHYSPNFGQIEIVAESLDLSDVRAIEDILQRYGLDTKDFRIEAGITGVFVFLSLREVADDA